MKHIHKHVHKHPHKKVPKPARVYRPKPFAFNVKEFKWIEDFWNKHKGEDIWVACPGAQLDQYPDDFFNDKISIALKGAISAFPNCTYSMFHYDDRRLRKYVNEGNVSLNKCIPKVFRYSHPVWKGPIYYLETNRGANWPYYSSLPQRILTKKIREDAPHFYRSTRSILQDGIQAAIILGAHRVILVACFHKGVGNQYHAQRRGMDRFYPGDITRFHRSDQIQGKIEGQKRSEQANRWLAQLFKPYGIQILRHHFGKEEFEDLAVRKLTRKEQRLAAPRKLTRKERKQLAALRRPSK